MTTFINDEGQEILVGEEITITKQVATFRNFKIKGDFSISFKIPNTSDNRTALGYYGVAQIGNPAFSKLPFNLTRAGNILSRGYIVIEWDNGKDLQGYFISGNANWFRAFDFSCKDIRNDSFTEAWNQANYDTRKAATSGIVFPIVDYLYRGLKFGKIFPNVFRPAYSPIFPCLYVHTLVSELAKVSSIKITGTLMNDPLYNSIVITPDGPDAIAFDGTNVEIQSIAPDMKAIDFIKWLTVTFGCFATFDEYSQTLSLDVIDKISKDNAHDWSEYFISYEVEYDKVKEKNFIRQADNPIQNIIVYNQTNEQGYGGVNLSSDKDDGSVGEIYKSPFMASYDQESATDLAWASPYVGFFKLEDDIGIAFTSVTNSGGALFNGTNLPFGLEDTYTFFRVEGSANYDGIHMVEGGTIPSTTTVESDQLFIANDTGTIYKQKMSTVKGHRILVNIPDLSTSNFTSEADLTFGIGYSSLATAYFHKPITSYSALNAYKAGMSYGTISGYNDHALELTHYNFINKMVTNPTQRAYFLLPESVFQSFDFGFVYIKTEKLTGYFFVEKIDNYLNSATPVRVDLLQID